MSEVNVIVIYLPTEQQGVHKNSIRNVRAFQDWIGILAMLVFEGRGLPEYPEKNLSEQSREPTTNSTQIWRRVGNWTRSTLVGDERSHHCAIPAPRDLPQTVPQSTNSTLQNSQGFHPFAIDMFSTNLPPVLRNHRWIAETSKVSSSDVISVQFFLTQDLHDFFWRFPNLWKPRKPWNSKDENNTQMSCKTTSTCYKMSFNAKDSHKKYKKCKVYLFLKIWFASCWFD